MTQRSRPPLSVVPPSVMMPSRLAWSRGGCADFSGGAARPFRHVRQVDSVHSSTRGSRVPGLTATREVSTR